jgi:8-oxo-dGTP pyrophosphatase MutT (NUDIX family)
MPRPISRQPIPEDARAVFNGVLFDVYQWSWAQFDGTINVFEKVRRPDTAYVLPVLGSDVVIARQGQPGTGIFLGPVGGRIEPGETPEEGAERELAEEAGFECGELELWAGWQPIAKVDWAIYLFIARHCRPVKAAPDPGEQILELMCLDFDGLLDAAADDRFLPEIAVFLLRLAVDAGRRESARSKLFPSRPPRGA